jgi:hypothetical protein
MITITTASYMITTMTAPCISAIYDNIFFLPAASFLNAALCSIQHYVIKFVNDLQQVNGFLRVLQFSPPIKLTDILLKGALNTINHIP